VSRRSDRRLQYAAACAAIAAYAGLSYYSNSVAGGRDLGAALALTPIAVVATILVWRTTPPVVAALLYAGLAAVIVGLWPVLRQNYPLINLVQDSSVYCLLGFTFGRSLMPGRVALCTQLADKEHGPLSGQEVRYTRQVTARVDFILFRGHRALDPAVCLGAFASLVFLHQFLRSAAGGRHVHRRIPDTAAHPSRGEAHRSAGDAASLSRGQPSGACLSRAQRHEPAAGA